MTIILQTAGFYVCKPKVTCSPRPLPSLPVHPHLRTATRLSIATCYSFNTAWSPRGTANLGPKEKETLRSSHATTSSETCKEGPATLSHGLDIRRIIKRQKTKRNQSLTSTVFCVLCSVVTNTGNEGTLQRGKARWDLLQECRGGLGLGTLIQLWELCVEL